MEWSWSDWERLKATTETQGDIRASLRVLIPTQGPQHQGNLNPKDSNSPCLEFHATFQPTAIRPCTHPFGVHTLASSSQHPVPAEAAFLRPLTQPALFHHCVPALISRCWTDAKGLCVHWVSPCAGCVSLVLSPVRTHLCLDGFVCPMDLHVQN